VSEAAVSEAAASEAVASDVVDVVLPETVGEALPEMPVTEAVDD
jgi:hypothetical protein